MNFKIITGSVDVHINELSNGGKMIEDKISQYIQENKIGKILNVHPVQVQWEQATRSYYVLYYSLTVMLE